MSTRNLLVGKKRPARRADNLSAIYELMTTAKSFHGLYRNNFTFLQDETEAYELKTTVDLVFVYSATLSIAQN
jgi:hypothetical protein